MTKRLIYYFYLTPDFKENRANRINLECLRRYAMIFDSADIYLSTDNTSDVHTIREAEKEFISMPFNGNISFKVVENTEFCESKVIKEEILDNLASLDCLVFFAHAKGYTNIHTYDYNLDGIQKWIVGCYYLSLGHMDNVDEILDGNYCTLSYGSFPVVSQKKIAEDELYQEWNNIFLGRIKHNWYYSGTFFWVNAPRLYNYLNVFSPTVPKMSDRYFGERLLGNLYAYDKHASGHNQRFLFPCNFYNEGVLDGALNFILNEDEYEDFKRFYDEIISKI